MGEAATALLFQGVKAGCDVVLRGRHGTSWYSHVSTQVSKVVFCVAGAILGRWQKMSCICRGRRSTLENSIVILRGTVHSTLHTVHSTLPTLHHTPHSTLYTPHSTLFTLHTVYSTLHTIHYTLYTPHFTLYTLHPHLTLHTSHF